MLNVIFIYFFNIYLCFRELKRVLLIIDNFVPVEVKTRLYTQARYDEELEEWTLNTSRLTENIPLKRPIAHTNQRRPMSNQALKLIESNDKDCMHVKGENILSLELDMPLRTTHDYENPRMSASLQAVFDEALKMEDDIEITDQVSLYIQYFLLSRSILVLIKLFAHNLATTGKHSSSIG